MFFWSSVFPVFSVHQDLLGGFGYILVTVNTRSTGLLFQQQDRLSGHIKLSAKYNISWLIAV